MDKSVIFAVAGSGKSRHLVEQIDDTQRTLVLTYTIRNVDNLAQKLNVKFGTVPANVHLSSYFEFLYSFCFKPFLKTEYSARGLNFEPCNNRYASGRARYIDANRRLYSNRVAKLLEVEDVLDKVITRFSKYFDLVLIDEIQDFAGHDFNLLKSITKAETKMLFVGDYYQHTFDTSRDGKINENLHKDYENYKNFFKQMGLYVDTTCLKKSYRCSPTICTFVTKKLGIDIHSHRTDSTEIHFVEDQTTADSIFQDQNIVKLFYQNSAKYPCHSANWGETKGVDTHGDVCVVLNETTLKEFEKGTLVDLVPKTKRKLYVAITRTAGDLYFVPEGLYKKRRAQ